MARLLMVLGWIFALAGIVAAFVLYPSDPLGPGFTVESYTLAKAIQPAQKMLAWQVAAAGVVTGTLTGALGCVLVVLEQILARIPQKPPQPSPSVDKEGGSKITL